MSKKYYWLKLKEDFFQDDAIEWLEDQKNGKEYALFYLKLCLKSLKTEGVLIRNVGTMLVPYDTNKISEITRTDVDTVIVAMEILTKIGLIELLENGEIYLPKLHEMIGSETDKAKSMRRLREERKALDDKNSNNVTKALPDSYQKDNSNNVTETLPKRYTEIEKEIEKEIDIEIEKEIRDRDQKIEYQLIVDMYNNTCVSFPKATKLSERRKRAIKARLNNGYTTEDFQKVFKMAEESNFLKGKNNSDWSATFDWLIKDANMVKVLDGNYDNKSAGSKSGGDRDILREMIERGAFDD